MFITFLFFQIPSFSQNDNGSGINNAGRDGRLRLNMPNTDQYKAESSSPFFSDRWMKSTLVLANGSVQSGLMIKLDLFENMVYFLDETNHQLLCGGDVELYKKTIKTLARSISQQFDQETKVLETFKG